MSTIETECWRRRRIDLRGCGRNPAQEMVRDESNWVSDISVPGSNQRRRQQRAFRMLAHLSRRKRQRRLAKLPLAQAPSPFRFHAQMLRVLVLGQVANHDELLVLFDHSNATADEKKLYVELIKRRWNSQKSRENQPDKKQYNFTLSTRVVSLLDTLADTHNLTRPKILEALIKMESKTGLYLGDREGNQMKPR